MSEWRWLESTRKLQETSFGVNYDELIGDKLADYLLVNAFSVNDEIAEAMKEFRWKSWSTGRGEFTDRDAFIDELVDAVHFIANAAVAAGATDEEWERRYRAKQARNAKRQEHGYDSKAIKCLSCRRELDKPGALKRVALTWQGQADSGYSALIKCAACDFQLGGYAPAVDDIIWVTGIEVPGISEESFNDG